MITKKELGTDELELLGEFEDESKLQLRIINNLAGSSILAIVMFETDDSFLVVAPSRLVVYGEIAKVEPYVPLPYARFFKSTLLSMTPVFNEFETKYLAYLLENANTLLDGFFSPKQVRYLEQRLYQLLNRKEPEKVEPKKEDLPSPSFMIESESKYKH